MDRSTAQRRETLSLANPPFDEVKVWGVGRQIQPLCAGGFNAIAHANDLVSGEDQHEKFIKIDEFYRLGIEGGSCSSVCCVDTFAEMVPGKMFDYSFSPSVAHLLNHVRVLIEL